MNIQELFKNFIFTQNEGTTEEKIHLIENKYNFVLPNFYKDILMFSNGIEMDSIVDEENSINLFKLEEIYEINIDIYETMKYLPDFLVIGNTGGEEVLVVEQNKYSKKIYLYEAGALLPNDENMIIVHLEKWFLNGCPMNDTLYKKGIY